MSVLSFPRLYFNGYMQWSPNTANNNDYVPTYDAADALLNFDYLGQQSPPITLENAQQQFPPWVIQPVADACPAQTGGPSDNCNPPSQPTSTHMASRWNYYGGNDCAFVQYGNFTTVAKGGVLGDGSPASPTDPILGQALSLLGTNGSAARMVDINPGSPFCTQIFFSTLGVGSGATSITTSPPPAGQALPRMYTRSFFVPRNTSADLIIAGAIGVVFQATIPTAWVTINQGSSDLLAAFAQALAEQGAQGLMLRLSAYTTLYYQNGIFNGISPAPRTCDELYALYREVQAGTIKSFVNPAYSSVTGAIGIWNEGELSTAPGGHMLVPFAQLSPVAGGERLAAVRTAGPIRVIGHAAVDLRAPAAEARAAAGGPSLALGVIHAEVNADAATPVVSLDLMNAFPESDTAGTKYDFGSFDVGVLMVSDPSDYVAPDASAPFNVIGSFDSAQYAKDSYQANGGILDVPFAVGVTAADVQTWLAGGLLALRAQQGPRVASVELPLTVETDDRGVYLDEGQTQTIHLQVRYKNAPPPADTQVLVAQYYPEPLTLGSGSLGLLQSPGGGSDVCTQTPTGSYVSFPTTPLAVDANGNASFILSPQMPGFPVLAFYPYLSGWTEPTPQSQLTFGFGSYGTFSICTAFFSTIRALAFDDDLVAEFIELWNSSLPNPDPTVLWNFVYNNVLMTYDLLYPVMKQFVNLGSETQVEKNITTILQLTVASGVQENTLYMPITRELSAGARLVLQLWGGLVEAGFPAQPLDASL